MQSQSASVTPPKSQENKEPGLNGVRSEYIPHVNVVAQC